MQIPRGMFRDLKRGCDLHTLIKELKDTAFNGYCRIASDSGSITIVFEKGNVLLAEYDTLEGDRALERIIQSGPVIVDAVLHDLSAAQLDLAVEFSPLSVVKSQRKRINTDEKGSERVAARQYLGDPLNIRNTGLKNKMPEQESRPEDTARHGLTAKKPAVISEGTRVHATDDEESLLSRELDALDAMDIENMAAKFRANCRLMMERLELEHLIDQNTGKDAP